MWFIFISLVLGADASYSCWMACPAGQSCELVDYWDSPAELRSLEGGACKKSDSGNISTLSTGQSYLYTCVNGSFRVKQLTPGKTQRVVGNDPNLKITESANIENDIQQAVALCEPGEGQERCFLAHQKLQNILTKNQPDNTNQDADTN